jgi:[ribosomal protein S18]-alanine N-acetyltransferase
VKPAIAPATEQTFDELARWRYPAPYDFYDGDVDPVLNPERFYEARDEAGELIGFLYFEEQGDGVVEIGLGLRPDLTGRGLGLDFVHAGLDFARERFAPSRIVLNVAAFNKRAIAVYERAGFRRTGSHVRSFMRWGDVPFVEMEERP